MVAVAVAASPLVVLMATGFYLNTSFADRRALRAIEAYCLRHGCTEATAFVNSRSSYGVRFRKNGVQYRGKCVTSPLATSIGWEKNDPAAL